MATRSDVSMSFQWRTADTVVLPLVTTICAAFTWQRLRIGWVPSDEGTLAQSAWRVLDGQWPHRDFNEVYSGGLSLLHALAFRVAGVNLFSLRLCVFFCFVLWVPLVYLLARRFVSPVWAGTVTLTAVAWSYPNYVAAMPSWYNLFLATAGTLALMRWMESRRGHWLLAAGLCAGFSVAIKIVGLYFLAAALLFLLFCEQEEVRTVTTVKRCRLFRVTITTGLALFLLGLTKMLSGHLHAAEIYEFLLPSAACCGLLFWRERGANGKSSSERFTMLWRTAGPLLAGFAIVVAAGILPYIVTGSGHALFSDLLGSIGARIVEMGGQIRPQGPLDVLHSGGPAIAILIAAMFLRWMGKRWVAFVAGAVFATALLCFNLLPANAGMGDIWLMGGTLTPLVVLLGMGLVAWLPKLDRAGRERVMLLCAVAAVCSLVQFPVSYVTYFCYVAPLVLLAALAVVSAKKDAPGRAVLACFLLFFLGIGLFDLVAKHIYNPGLDTAHLYTLTLPRAGGLRVDSSTPDYASIMPFLLAHSPNGVMYCGNDCPELYFLSGLRPAVRDDTGVTTAAGLAAFARGNIHLAVVNERTAFVAGGVHPELRAEIARRLPHVQSIGRFTVYWD